MAKIPVIHSLVAKDGKYIVMPAYKGGQAGWGNLAHPNVYSESVIQEYPIGTKFVDDDRIWRYVKAGNTCTRGRLLQSYNRFSDGTNVEYAVVPTAGVVGDDHIHFTAVGTVTENMFAGGYAILQSGRLMYRIQEHDAVTALAAGTVTIDGTLRNAITALSHYVQLMRDIYSNVQYLSSGATAGWGTGVCVGHHTITSGSYAFGQTWGPCMVAGTDNYGANVGERLLVMGHDGASILQTEHDETYDYQNIGPIIAYTGDGDGTGTDMPGAMMVVMLMLAP